MMALYLIEVLVQFRNFPGLQVGLSVWYSSVTSAFMLTCHIALDIIVPVDMIKRSFSSLLPHGMWPREKLFFPPPTWHVAEGEG